MNDESDEMSDEELIEAIRPWATPRMRDLLNRFEALLAEHEALKAAARKYLEISTPDYPGCECRECVRFKKLQELLRSKCAEQETTGKKFKNPKEKSRQS